MGEVRVRTIVPLMAITRKDLGEVEREPEMFRGKSIEAEICEGANQVCNACCLIVIIFSRLH